MNTDMLERRQFHSRGGTEQPRGAGADPIAERAKRPEQPDTVRTARRGLSWSWVGSGAAAVALVAVFIAGAMLAQRPQALAVYPAHIATAADLASLPILSSDVPADEVVVFSGPDRDAYFIMGCFYMKVDAVSSCSGIRPVTFTLDIGRFLIDKNAGKAHGIKNGTPVRVLVFDDRLEVWAVD